MTGEGPRQRTVPERDGGLGSVKGAETASGSTMPPPAPLAFPVQDLSQAFRDPAAPGPTRRAATGLWRTSVFGGALGLTLALLAVGFHWFSGGGWTAAEGMLLAMTAMTLGWIALPFASAAAVIAAGPPTALPTRGSGPGLRVAILVPIHEEDVAAVFAIVTRLAQRLALTSGAHRFQIFVLSDSQEPETVAAESAAYAPLAALGVHYRRRARNADRKAGNIAEWVRGWGAAHDAMVPLDADSHMTPAALIALADALAAEPGVGLIQTQPRLIRAQSVFGRLQQFSAAIYGLVLFRGMALWSGNAANYWGHNAIIRVRAFAASAGLPRVGRRRRLIMSHDFVEAALMRRAGWGVRLMPEIDGSFEECPQTLIGFALRDRRWCRGNLQHLRLLAVPGLHPLSRLHLLHGAIGYLMSPLWLALLVAWIVHSAGAPMPEIGFFGDDPRYRIVAERPEVWSLGLMVAIYATLLGPKLMASVAMLVRLGRSERPSSRLRFAGNVALEIAAAMAYAPIMMVQQSKAVVAALVGASSTWAPQQRGRSGQALLGALRFHWLETGLGLAGIAALATGTLSPWLAPVVASLAMAAPLSWLSARPAPGVWQVPDGDAGYPPASSISPSTQSSAISAQ
ncbi:MAG: glucans biosynthesis glucosyltransferase MdoH [Pseudomonadota bacterium]